MLENMPRIAKTGLEQGTPCKGETLRNLGVLVTVLLMAPLASAATLTGTGDGFCINTTFGCDNTNTSVFANTFAGSHFGHLYQDWFAFVLPSTPISSATISIGNDGHDFNHDPSAVYSLYAASSISY